MKKVISILLCMAMLITSCAIAASAKESDIRYNGYPVILVPGYSACFLVDTDTGEQVWGGTGEVPVADMILGDIAELGPALGAMTVGNADKIAKFVGQGILEVCAPLACDESGNSVYPLERKYTSAADTQYSTLMERYPDMSYCHEPEICAEIAEYTGYDNIFNFTSDFRMGSEACAKMLNDYIDDVKAFTGKDKVNLFAISHGGQTASTYLTLYGWQKNDVANALLNVPAIGGAGIAYDPMMEDIHLDLDCLARFIEFGFHSETDYDWLLKAQRTGYLDTICNKIVRYAMDGIQYWGSMWDFVPTDKYEEVKAFRLDPVKNKELIAKSDRFHYEILPQVSEKFKLCQQNGVNITIIAGTGNPIVTGLQVNSDGIIPTACSTGATCAPLGSRFADGYTQKNDCDGKYKVNPAMTVDASTAYLPDDTFYVEGLYHGMTNWDLYVRELMFRAVLDDTIQNVYSDPNFPQFHDSTSPALSVYTEFNGCQAGYIDSNAKSLHVENTCWESDITITSITVDGLDLRFNVKPEILKPGEVTDISFTGDIPQVSKQEVNITVTFLIKTVTPACYRTQGFTVMNGTDTEYKDGYVNATQTAFDKLIGEKPTEFLKKLGLNEFLSMIYNVLVYWFGGVTKIFSK